MGKRTTIYDIAKRLGISTATVNRAIAGKPLVKEETRRLVLQTAQEMGFRPNTLARSLARRQLRLAVVAFTSFPDFHGSFLQGARYAGKELADFNVAIDYFSYDEGASNTPEADQFLEDVLGKVNHDGYDGLLALARNANAFELLREKGVYVATAVNDIDSSLRRFHICYNGFVAGRIAAELLYRWLPDAERPVAIASGWKDMGIHKRIVDGFMQQLRSCPLNLCAVCYNMDNEDIAYENTLRLLSEQPHLGAIYVNSFNSRGVIRAVEEKGREGDLVLITSDISAQLRKLIQSGMVSASIFQNQYEQGRQGVHLLYQALANAQAVEDTIVIAPQIILQSNLTLF